MLIQGIILCAIFGFFLVCGIIGTVKEVKELIDRREWLGKN